MNKRIFLRITAASAIASILDSCNKTEIKFEGEPSSDVSYVFGSASVPKPRIVDVEKSASVNFHNYFELNDSKGLKSLENLQFSVSASFFVISSEMRWMEFKSVHNYGRGDLALRFSLPTSFVTCHKFDDLVNLGSREVVDILTNQTFADVKFALEDRGFSCFIHELAKRLSRRENPWMIL